MTIKTKICGITTPEALDAAIAGHADFVGFMFYGPSPRNLSFELAHNLSCHAGSRISKVGVFVDPSDELLSEAIASSSLDILQLHKVTAQRRAEAKTRFGLPVWAVMPIKQGRDLACRHHIDESSADLVLYDAATPKGMLPGGMGVRIDWSLFQGLAHPYPWGLAGGLNAANVAEAVRITGAPLVDVSSGVEDAPGVKSVDKIVAFLKAAREL